MNTAKVLDLTPRLEHRIGMVNCFSCERYFLWTYPIALDNKWKECPFCEEDKVQFSDLGIPGE